MLHRYVIGPQKRVPGMIVNDVCVCGVIATILLWCVMSSSTQSLYQGTVEIFESDGIFYLKNGGRRRREKLPYNG